MKNTETWKMKVGKVRLLQPYHDIIMTNGYVTCGIHDHLLLEVKSSGCFIHCA